MGEDNSTSHHEADKDTRSVERTELSSDADDRNADRRDARSRARRLKRLLDDLEVEPKLADEIVSDLSSLLPPQHRMSRDEDVTVRLKALLERDAKSPPDPLMRHSGAEIDVSSEGTIRSTEKLSELVQDGDERLLQSYVANQRIRSVLAGQIAEHDVLRNVLVAELARRYTVNEQWRYKLPKFMMPLIAVMLKAGVRRDDLRLGNTLLGAIIDLLSERFKTRGVTRDGLFAAAENASSQFESFDPEAAMVEPFEVAEERLSPLYRQLQKEWRQKKDAPSEAKLRPAQDLTIAGGGLDEHGRPVFKNLDDFGEALNYLREQRRL